MVAPTRPARSALFLGAAGVAVMSGGAPQSARPQVASSGRLVKASCSGILPQKRVLSPLRRPIAPLDLARLRDIGFVTGFAKDSPISVSPDGKKIAFVITRADPASNDYCEALVTLELDTKKPPSVIDTGGSFIPVMSNIRGNWGPTGAPAVITPRWSPDGRWVAYPKRTDGVTQAWIVSADGREARAVTKSDADVDTLAWSQDGRRVLYEQRPGVAAARESIRSGGDGGYLYDDHLVPFNGPRPLVPAPQAIGYFSVDVKTNERADASPSDRALLDPITAGDVPSGARKVARSGTGAVAWTAPRIAGRLMSKVDLWAKVPNGVPTRCDDKRCEGQLRGIEDLWWTGDSVLFLRREGWGYSQIAIYRWQPGKALRRILVTDDLLMGCILAGARLLCTDEGSDRPRRLINVDTSAGKISVLYDPNPEFAAIKLGRVERLRWRNEYGFESFGDLVLPPDFRRGIRIPLIVVQYISRGFLRGGVGDEYPIQSFAARGYAVLSVQGPPAFYEALPDPGWQRWEDGEVENIKGWRDRRSNLSTVLSGVDLLVHRGIADPKRVGITGLSDGATTVQFALVNRPNAFAVVSVSSCFMDPDSVRIYGGTAWYNQLKSVGFPALSREDPEFWTNFSVSENVARINVPILMQVPEHEFILSLESFAKLKDAGRPVEMLVFPDEYHVKSQPAHRLAIYQRNLDWFDYWLKGKRSPDPAKVSQYERWDALRAARAALSQEAIPPATKPAFIERAHNSTSRIVSSRRN